MRLFPPPFSVRTAASVLVGLAAAAGVGLTLWREQEAPPATEPRAARDLPAFVVVEGTGAPGAADGAGQGVTVAPVGRGAGLTGSNLVRPRGSVAGWWRISVPASSSLRLRPGERVVLVGTTGDSVPPALVDTAGLVLAAGGDTAVLALPPASAVRAAAYLAGKRRLLVLGVLDTLPADTAAGRAEAPPAKPRSPR